MTPAEALREAAAEQRRLAADAPTNNGWAEHTERADWLEERADRLAGETGGGEHDDAVLGLVTDGEQGLGTCSTHTITRAAVDAALIANADSITRQGDAVMALLTELTSNSKGIRP